VGYASDCTCAWGQKESPSRPEAIRRLRELALSGAEGPKQRSPKARAKAQDLAGTQLDKGSDPSATDEERQTRKRRLLKGPKELRAMRDAAHSNAKR
jgi:hypothetical protein